MIPPLFGKQEVGIWQVQKRFPWYGVPIWSLWPNSRFLPSIVAEKDVTKNVHICSMWEAFLYPSDSCFLFANFLNFYTHLTYIVYMHIFHHIFLSNYWWQSRNLTGPKTFPTIWHTYMKLVTKYQIPVINSCWEKCDEKCAYIQMYVKCV
jgi:hypothetical protein